MTDETSDTPTGDSAGPRSPEGEPRRNFLAGLAAMVMGAVASAVPLAAGATALLDPLRRHTGPSDMVLVTRLSAVPTDGAPQKFTVTADRTDAWATYADTPIGAVYLRRTGDDVVALNTVCPHAGCFVGLAPDRSRFACPCHKSSFDLDGVVNDPASPSPRDMDVLETEVRNGDEVWVRFQHFLPGREDKTPV